MSATEWRDPSGMLCGVLSEVEAWRLLRELDDPEAVERPTTFDERSVARRFTALVENLEASFACGCAIDSAIQVQDASHYGTVIVPASSTRTGSDIVVRTSNFGSLAVYDVESFGAYDDSEPAILFDRIDRDRVEQALVEAGHSVVPQDLLWAEYDGANAHLRAAYPGEHRPSWFIRYFDWI